MSGLKAKYWENIRLQMESNIETNTKGNPKQFNIIDILFQLPYKDKKAIAEKLLEVGENYRVVDNQYMEKLHAVISNKREENAKLESDNIKLKSDNTEYVDQVSRLLRERDRLHNRIDKIRQEAREAKKYHKSREKELQEYKEAFYKLNQQRNSDIVEPKQKLNPTPKARKKRAKKMDIEDWLDL